MDRSSLKIASLAELLSMDSNDNQEKMVNLEEESADIISRCHRHQYPAALRKILIRKSVADKLIQIQEDLRRIDPFLKLMVAEGYRHPFFQKTYFEQEFQKLAQQHPDYSFETLQEMTHQLIAVPSVAGHPTGGAVDVTLYLGDMPLDMGTEIAVFDEVEKIPTFAPNITLKQKANRQLLLDHMLKYDFAPFYGEWWHFSYGDKEWAVFYDKPKAFYTEVILEI